MQRGQINVAEHGAKGDGVADDTAAILSAVTALKRRAKGRLSGATLYFPPGCYRVSHEPFADFDSVYGNVVVDIADMDGVKIVGDSATIKVDEHDIAKYGGLRFIRLTNCHGITVSGLRFEMTFRGLKNSSEFYPRCGAIVIDNASSDSGQDASLLSGDILIDRCNFKLFHPMGAYAATSKGNTYQGDPNNGYKVFSVFVNSPHIAHNYSEMSRNCIFDRCIFEDGHNAYGFWTWAHHAVQMRGCIAESWCNSGSTVDGGYLVGLPMLRVISFAATDLIVSGNTFRARPSNERTGAFRGIARFVHTLNNQDGFLSPKAKVVVSSNILTLGNGDAANDADDIGVYVYERFGSFSITNNVFTGHPAAGNDRGGHAIRVDARDSGDSLVSIVANTFGEHLDYTDSMYVRTGAATVDTRPVRQLLVNGNVCESKGAYFLRADYGGDVLGPRQFVLTNNSVSGEKSAWPIESDNSRCVQWGQSDEGDIYQINGNAIRHVKRGFQAVNSSASPESTIVGNVMQDVTVPYIGVIPR